MIPLLLCSVAVVYIALENFFFYISAARRLKLDILACEKVHPLFEELCQTLKAHPGDEKRIEKEAHRIIEALTRRLDGLEFLASIATLLGLTGTVSGMVKTFMTIQQRGERVSIALLAGGIWEALLTTLFGLVIAVVALTSYFFLIKKAEGFAVLLEQKINAWIKSLDGQS